MKKLFIFLCIFFVCGTLYGGTLVTPDSPSGTVGPDPSFTTITTTGDGTIGGDLTVDGSATIGSGDNGTVTFGDNGTIASVEALRLEATKTYISNEDPATDTVRLIMEESKYGTHTEMKHAGLLGSFTFDIDPEGIGFGNSLFFKLGGVAILSAQPQSLQVLKPLLIRGDVNNCILTVDDDGTCDAGSQVGIDNSILLCMVCVAN